ncbi:hypothetical protein D3C80_1988570 [compost metagenome]
MPKLSARAIRRVTETTSTTPPPRAFSGSVTITVSSSYTDEIKNFASALPRFVSN